MQLPLLTKSSVCTATQTVLSPLCLLSFPSAWKYTTMYLPIKFGVGVPALNIFQWRFRQMNELYVIDRAWAFLSCSGTHTLNSTQILLQRPKQLHWISSEGMQESVSRWSKFPQRKLLEQAELDNISWTFHSFSLKTSLLICHCKQLQIKKVKKHLPSPPLDRGVQLLNGCRYPNKLML